jgi:hypothetical protein
LVALISNCRPKYRLTVLQTLISKGLSVHSKGACLNNVPINIQQNNQKQDRVLQKKNVIRPYKFTFSFENSETEDYVTEKLFEALEAGSVPVYFGAPNVDAFLPNKKSAILAKDFP